ncbi:MAG: helix-turn-helix transcriptional regulator [Deltaproteobacteria bacterium]|nr:helix-turn-helix transcriptional regulator [Deltaproteobacteria bacterium]
MMKKKGLDSGEIEGLKIGNKIRELRQKRHYTVEDLAAKTDLPKSLLAEIESGDVSPPIAT